ncbi:MAG: TatD family hydrolase [Eubacteriales bacterium]|nr:TatD family hydrolase [Eubacteriales bacterium]
MRIFDTHAHYDDEKFAEDRADVLYALHHAGVECIIDPGCDMQSSYTAQSLAADFDFVYFAAGIHPEELDAIPEDYLAQLTSLAGDSKCVAIGEIGLDYYWDSSRKELQKQIFREQLELARELGKPVIIHDREAHGDSFEIVNSFWKEKNPAGSPGVFHCYSGSAEMAEELLKRGWYLGFDGPVTYKNARKTLEVLEITPPDRILIETDSPYLSPVPMRGKRNDSGNLVYVIQKIAEIKGLTPEETAELTFENAKRLFFRSL